MVLWILGHFFLLRLVVQQGCGPVPHRAPGRSKRCILSEYHPERDPRCRSGRELMGEVDPGGEEPRACENQKGKVQLSRFEETTLLHPWLWTSWFPPLKGQREGGAEYDVHSSPALLPPVCFTLAFIHVGNTRAGHDVKDTDLRTKDKGSFPKCTCLLLF